MTKENMNNECSASKKLIKKFTCPTQALLKLMLITTVSPFISSQPSCFVFLAKTTASSLTLVKLSLVDTKLFKITPLALLNLFVSRYRMYLYSHLN